MSSAVEQAAEKAKSQIAIGSPSAAAMSLLRENGFSCQPIADRTQELDRPSFLCGKMVEQKRWLGLMTDYHHVQIVINDDGRGNVATANVKVVWVGNDTT